MSTSKVIILAFLVLIIALVVGFFWVKKPLDISVFRPQTWEVTLEFNTENQTLSLKKISTLSQSFRPDYRGAANSPYSVLVVDEDEKPLFQSKINITEVLFFAQETDYYQRATDSSSLEKPISSLDTTIFIPYFKNAKKIIILKNGQVVLEIKVNSSTQSLNFHFIRESFAQLPQNSTGPMQVVFISDGYTSEQQFLSDSASLKNTFATTPPYSSSNIFQFQEVYNQTSLGCTQSFQCILNPTIKTVGLSRNPQASKFIVLVRGNANPNDIGLTNDLGGDTVVLKTDGTENFLHVGIHEFLGHSAGQLYDRYVLTTKPGIRYNIRSNCTDNPSGEAFWREAGVQRAYRGCDTWYLYGPSPLECNPPYLPPAPGGELPPYPPPPGIPPLLNSGNRSTIMSSGGCSGNQFDIVEQYWIRTQIIPRYQAALPPPPPPTGSPPPSSENDCSFSLLEGQLVRGEVLTYVFARRASPSYYVSLVLLNSTLGDIVGAVSQTDNLTINWNSVNLFQNGPATLQCNISDAPFGGSSIFSKEITVSVGN